jgi:iron complex outermembrane receptor protein
MSFAFHYKRDVHEEQDDEFEPWERYEAETFSYGFEDDIKITEQLNFVAGLNYDVQKAKYANGEPLRDDDEVLNGLGGAVYRLGDGTRIHGSVSKKSRFPTLRELYSSLLGAVIPNPNLEREESINYELGVERPLPWQCYAGITGFYSDVEDLIVRTTVGGLDFYDNIGESRFQGIELSFRMDGVPRNTFEAHYTYLDAENRSEDRTSDYLPESPRHQLYFSDLFRVQDWLSLFAKAEYREGQREETSNGEWVELNSYWLFDLKAMVDVYKNIVAEVGVRNMFDKDYQTGYGFPREGRTFFVGIRGTF